MSLFLGIDLGTSGCRITAIDQDARVQAEARAAFPAPQRQGLTVEQEPQIWWDRSLHCLEEINKKIDPKAVRALCVDGTSSTVFLCDSSGEPLHPALMYNDARAQVQAQNCSQSIPAQSAAHGASATVAKVLWLKDQGLDLTDKRIVHQADWISARLSGQWGVSDSNNCLKLGYDPLSQRWPDWLMSLGIPDQCLPRVFKPGTIIGEMDKVWQQKLGYRDTFVVSGTTDSTAAFIASGAQTEGDAVTALGSTLVLKMLSDKPVNASEYGIYSQPYNDVWLCGGASNSGGAVLLNFFSPEQMREMSHKLDPQGDTGLNFYPLLQAGERFPVNDPEWTGRLSPRPKDDLVFFQGLLEGIAAVEKRGYDLLGALSGQYPTKVFSNGGGASNSAWTKIRERILNIPVLTAKHTEAAYGAAKLALQALAHNQHKPGG